MDNIRIVFRDRKQHSLCIKDIEQLDYTDGIISFFTKNSEIRRDYMIPVDAVLHSIITEEL